MSNRIASFAHRLAQGDAMIGTFVKTPSAIVCEVLGCTALDVCCLDAEHAPFGRMELDACISALRAANMPSLVRVANDSATEIRNVLDSGATGIIVPHVTSAEQAERIIHHAHFGEGGRGYAGSTRAAGFTRRPMAEHVERSRQETTIVLQIEDLAALDQVDKIAAVPEVHALFIGRADLAVAMGEAIDSAAVIEAVLAICHTASRQGRTSGMFAPSADELSTWIQAGSRLFLLDSDHGFMLKGAHSLRTQFDAAK